MDIILKYFKNLNDDITAKLASLFDIYSRINEKVNLISRKDFDNLYLHHVLHSLSILKCIDIKNGSGFIDVGTGGGFPGIPLAILRPDCNFVLIDSIGKKIKAVEEIKKELNLKNVDCYCVRAENYKGKFNYITGRAIADLSVFINYTKHLLKDKNSSILYLKGGNVDEELDKLNYCSNFYNLKDVFEEEYFETKKLVVIS